MTNSSIISARSFIRIDESTPVGTTGSPRRHRAWNLRRAGRSPAQPRFPRPGRVDLKVHPRPTSPTPALAWAADERARSDVRFGVSPRRRVPGHRRQDQAKRRPDQGWLVPLIRIRDRPEASRRNRSPGRSTGEHQDGVVGKRGRQTSTPHPMASGGCDLDPPPRTTKLIRFLSHPGPHRTRTESVLRCDASRSSPPRREA